MSGGAITGNTSGGWGGGAHLAGKTRISGGSITGNKSTKVNFDIALFECYTRGFLQGAQGGLTEEELKYLPWGARLMTLECGIRFLTDYLDGDNYFRVRYPEQNLRRCRTQFKLAQDMETQFSQMQAIVQKYSK